MSGTRGGETELHQRLKWATSAVLLVRGLPLVGLEVRVPGLRRRADVAGVGDLAVTARRYSSKERATKDAYIGAAPTVTIAEIKASRADLLRDIGDHAELLDKLGGLHTRRNELEAVIRQDEPGLRFRSSLLSEEDAWRYDQSKNAGYHKLVKEIARVRANVFGKTKFDLLARSGIADEYLLVTAPGICKIEEIPEQWGWMSIDCDSAAARLQADEMQAARAQAAGPGIEPAAAAKILAAAALNLPELGWGPGWELPYKHPAVQARWMTRGKTYDPVALGSAGAGAGGGVGGGVATGAASLGRRRKKGVMPGEQLSLFVEAGAAAEAEGAAVSRGAKPAALSPSTAAAAKRGGRNLITADPSADAPVAVWIYPGIGKITLHVAPQRFNCAFNTRKKWERALAQSGSALLRQLLSGRLHEGGSRAPGLPAGIPFCAEE